MSERTHPDMWVDPEDDPRETGAAPSGEKEVLADYLDHYRRTLEMKCEGLRPEQLARRSVPPSTLSLLGLVRHMAKVEHSWFQRGLQGRLDEPRPFDRATERDVDFDGAEATTECVGEAFEAWQEQVTLAEEYLAGLAEETLGDTVTYNSDGATTSVRDVLVHMVEEYARHVGHADLLRECIDGRTGQ